MTAEEKLRKWPFHHAQTVREDAGGNRIHTITLFHYVIKKIDGNSTLCNDVFDEFLYKVEMKNGDIIKF